MPSSSDVRPRRSSHLSRQPEVSDAWEGRGHGGREPAGQTRGRFAPRRCSWATGLANLLPPPRAARRNAQPSEPAPARPPAPGAAARALGPQKGRRARRRQRRTYRARLARAARSLPGRRHRVHPSRAQIQHLAKFKGAGRSGEGAPRRERSRGDRGRVRGGGENSKCYNFLPCPPPGLGGRGTREGRAARAERQ